MSKISFKPADTGTATFTIEAPATNTNRTLTLPDEAGSVLTNGGAINVDQSAPTESAVIDSSGNLGIGTSSPAVALDVSGQMRASSGILFGADTAASNTLDDYEEGTWSPSVSKGGVTVNYARYTKIGRIVTIYCGLRGFTNRSSSSRILISGVPFTSTRANTDDNSPENSFSCSIASRRLGVDTANTVPRIFFYNATSLEITQDTDYDPINLLYSDIPNSFNKLQFTMVYETDS